MSIDWRGLLERYMAHVLREEGVSFVEYPGQYGSDEPSAGDMALLGAVLEEVQFGRRPPVVVCAACRRGDLVVCGPRHFDATMRRLVNAMGLREATGWEQGFVDQSGRFLTREEAMVVVRASGQAFDPARNGGDGSALYSEGLY